MFTGIIAKTGRLVKIERQKQTLLRLRTDGGQLRLTTGDSLAVNGICLTLVEERDSVYSFNLSDQTWRLSNFPDLSAGAVLNLEPPLKMNDYIGGHLVSGHIDGTVRLKSRHRQKDSTALTFVYSTSHWRQYMVPKGSIALNGVSLTLAAVQGSSFQVVVIPHTLESTNLGRLNVSDRVNVEFDLMGKYLYNQSSVYGKIK